MSWQDFIIFTDGLKVLLSKGWQMVNAEGYLLALYHDDYGKHLIKNYNQLENFMDLALKAKYR
jgi:hypothetical protein